MSKHSKALPVGRILRFLLGLFLGVAVWPFFQDASSNRILMAVLVLVGLSALYAMVHRLVSSFLARLNSCLGAFLACLPLALVFVLGGVLGQVGALSFLAISLLLAAIRADPGCEVMSIPSLVFGKHTHLMCLLFSPIDWVEERLAAALRPSSTNPE